MKTKSQQPIVLSREELEALIDRAVTRTAEMFTSRSPWFSRHQAAEAWGISYHLLGQKLRYAHDLAQAGDKNAKSWVGRHYKLKNPASTQLTAEFNPASAEFWRGVGDE